MIFLQGTYVTSYEDGVYAVVNGLYGLAVYTDGKSLEVQTYQHLLRNKACGLCGDLNDEKVGDVKSPGSCIMSSPALAAQTYMVPDQTCQAPSQEDQERIRQETEQWCVKKQTFPTQVSHIYRQPQPLYSKHLVEYKENKICFSTQQVKVCPSNSNPQEIKQQKVNMIKSFYHIFLHRPLARFPTTASRRTPRARGWRRWRSRASLSRSTRRNIPSPTARLSPSPSNARNNNKPTRPTEQHILYFCLSLYITAGFLFIEFLNKNRRILHSLNS